MGNVTIYMSQKQTTPKRKVTHAKKRLIPMGKNAYKIIETNKKEYGKSSLALFYPYVNTEQKEEHISIIYMNENFVCFDIKSKSSSQCFQIVI